MLGTFASLTEVEGFTLEANIFHRPWVNGRYIVNLRFLLELFCALTVVNNDIGFKDLLVHGEAWLVGNTWRLHREIATAIKSCKGNRWFKGVS